jgi:hypothetical protein
MPEPAPPRRRPESHFPFWGVLALPACALWGTVIGLATGMYLGNAAIGGAIGAGLGVGIGLALLAAAIVVASTKV